MEEVTLTEEESLEMNNEADCKATEGSTDSAAELVIENDGDQHQDINQKESVENNTNVQNDLENNLEEKSEDVLDKLIAKLKVLELQNSEYVGELDDQKKVIEMLRQEVTKKDDEVLVLEKNLKETSESLNKKYSSLNEESSRKINELKRAFDQANKDKESMVIKYAMGEKDILIARRGRDEFEKKLKEALKDNDSYQYKVKTLGTERTRLQGLCEARGQETNVAKKETDKLREDLKLCEAKLALANDKYKSESEAHKNTKENLDRTFKELLEVQGTIDDIKKEYTDLIDKAKQEEESKRLKEKIQEKEQSVKLMIDSAAAAELETLKKKYKEAIDENNDLSIKVQSNEKDLLKHESSLSELKETLANQKSEIVDLYSKCAELESVKVQLGSESEKVSARDAEISRLRSEAAELLSDMASCRKKEGELLEFTQKLTDKNVTLQSEFSSIEARAGTLEDEHSRIVSNQIETETKLNEVLVQLDIETKKRKEETELLARKLAEKVKSLETANQRVIDANNEVEVIRRQNQARVRELTKELNTTKKRLEAGSKDGVHEDVVRGREGSPGQLSLSSRCSSSSSLSRDCEMSPNNSGETNLHHQQANNRVSMTSIHENGNQVCYKLKAFITVRDFLNKYWKIVSFLEKVQVIKFSSLYFANYNVIQN